MTDFRGYPACACLVKWLPAYEAELQRRGILSKATRLRIYQLIGGAKASGGTHSEGGAFDLLDLPGGLDIWVARQMGADATWSRLYDWDNRKGIAHIHGVLTGCPHNDPARYQIDDVRRGLNGLANHGKDTGPRPLSGRTWEQGIAWAKAQARPAPAPKPAVKMRTTEVRIYNQNTASGQGGFTPRAEIIADRAEHFAAHFLNCQELNPNHRPKLSTALKGQMSMASNYGYLTQYLVDNDGGFAKVGNARKWDLGNGRVALAVRYLHRQSGCDFVLVDTHFSHPHEADEDRKQESNALGGYLAKYFQGLPKVIVGDFNDAHKDTVTRPNDTSGDVLEKYGFHDLYYDVSGAHRKGEQYNTANQNQTPPPSSGIHIDRFFGSEMVEGLAWRNDIEVHAADHNGVFMTVRITHPVK